jgi:uncharacterized membrane protein
MIPNKLTVVRTLSLHRLLLLSFLRSFAALFFARSVDTLEVFSPM